MTVSYTHLDVYKRQPLYVSEDGFIERSIVCGNSTIEGTVIGSVIGAGVTIGKGAVVRDSIIMKDTVIGPGCTVDKSIIAEEVVIGENCKPVSYTHLDVYKRQVIDTA